MGMAEPTSTTVKTPSPRGGKVERKKNNKKEGKGGLLAFKVGDSGRRVRMMQVWNF